MTSQRPRRPRTASAAEFHLRIWAELVRRVEEGPWPIEPACPCCNGELELESRDRLEAMIRRGGKQGRRIARAVRDLDARFERATWPTPEPQNGFGWWHHRWSRP